jgi:hypothetical protein
MVSGVFMEGNKFVDLREKEEERNVADTGNPEP